MGLYSTDNINVIGYLVLILYNIDILFALNVIKHNIHISRQIVYCMEINVKEIHFLFVDNYYDEFTYR